jgi:hypothetical protein
MALSFSQGALEAMLERMSVVGVCGTDIALVIGTDDTITRTAADFVSEGFVAGMQVYVFGATDTDDNITATRIKTVAAGTLTFDGTGIFTTGEAASAKITVVAAKGGCFANLFNGGKITYYNGTKPANADAAKGGATAIFEFDNLQFDAAATWDSAEKEASIDLTESITDTAAADGTVAWFRMTASGENRDDASSTAIRVDGTLGSSGDIVVAQTAVTSGDPETLNAMVFKYAQ